MRQTLLTLLFIFTPIIALAHTGRSDSAIVAFLESESFEDAIKNAISIGGDSDTLGAITGAVAEAYYGIPDDLKETALSYLDERLSDITKRFVEKYIE